MRWAIVALAATLLHLSGFTEGSTLTPPVLPLVVRNPYLSAWLGNAREEPWSKWPMFYTGEEIGLSLMAYVPESGNTYPLLGKPQDSLLPQHPTSGYNVSYPLYKGAKYDASTTNMTYSIPSASGYGETVEITLSFLSPITPTSTLRQSIPASYVTVYAEGSFDVSVYMDVNGQWVSGDRGARIEWGFDQINVDDDDDDDDESVLKKWQVRRETELLLTERSDRSEWGTMHFTGPADVRHESGTSGLLRSRFARTGTLQNVNDDEFRPIMEREPVFAFAKEFSLGESSKSTADSVTFSITHIQDPVAQFASARGLTMMKPLWESWFHGVDKLISFHYGDFDNAAVLAANYSAQLDKDAYRSGADDYVDIVALSARQVLGATSFSGTADNPILFLKEISSNGNFQTIDVIFPSFPFFLYTNPRWLAYLLEPLIEHMLSGQYPNTYAMHDIGTHFPNATGHPDGNDEYMPVEECGNIVIMGLALVNSLRYDEVASSVWSAEGHDDRDALEDTGLFPLLDLQTRNGIGHLDSRWGGGKKGLKKARKWVRRTYSLWEQWTGYLVEFSLRPHNQLSTDDFAGWLALQTNLALKGIIGINAMSELAALIGHDKEAKSYKNISDTYISKWEEYGFSRDKTHAKVSYDWYGSWTTIYNLYADAQLCFHLDGTDHAPSPLGGGQKPLLPPNDADVGFVPRHVYTKQSSWYHNVRQKYGLPLDSRHLYTKSDWEFFAMAVTSQNTRQEILDSVALWVNETITDKPLTDLYRTEGKGGFPGPNFFARPVVGGHFAFLALERACGGKAMEGLAFLDEADPPKDGGEETVSSGPALHPGNFEL